MLKKFTLFVCVLLAASYSFAQTARVSTLHTKKMSRTLEQQLDSLSKALTQQAIKQIHALSTSDNQKHSTSNLQERCGEGLHTHAQAKNHKGPCYWLSEQTPIKQAPTSFFFYDKEKGEYVFVRSDGKIWTWKKPVLEDSTKIKNTVVQSIDLNKKYPPYW